MTTHDKADDASGVAPAPELGRAIASDRECCNFPDPFPLGRVVMPLVRVMERGHLSWAEREEIARAIQECLRHHKSLMDEHEHHMRAACGAQQKTTPNRRANGRRAALSPGVQRLQGAALSDGLENKEKAR